MHVTQPYIRLYLHTKATIKTPRQLRAAPVKLFPLIVTRPIQMHHPDLTAPSPSNSDHTSPIHPLTVRDSGKCLTTY